MDAANVSERHFHKRYVFARLLLTYGAPIDYASEQLGHSRIEMTVKLYGKLLPGANRRFINELPGSSEVLKQIERV